MYIKWFDEKINPMVYGGQNLMDSIYGDFKMRHVLIKRSFHFLRGAIILLEARYNNFWLLVYQEFVIPIFGLLRYFNVPRLNIVLKKLSLCHL